MPYAVVNLSEGALVTLGLTLLGALLLALDERLRRKFAPREQLFDSAGRPLFATLEQLNDVGSRVNGVVALFERLDDRIATNETRIGSMESALREMQTVSSLQHGQVIEKIGDTARSMEAIAKEMREISHAQAEQAGVMKSLLKERSE